MGDDRYPHAEQRQRSPVGDFALDQIYLDHEPERLAGSSDETLRLVVEADSIERERARLLR